MTEPTVRVDRDAFNDRYLWAVEQVLHRIADAVNALTLTGAIYSQLSLPPEQADIKRTGGAQ